MDATTCKTCQRAVWTTDVDGEGYCIFCVPTVPAAVSVGPRGFPGRGLTPEPVAVLTPDPKT
jgi:hypothetical protein